MKLTHDYYFVGNAHLDPVWMWRWQEGSAEAKATVRSALDRMKEYPDFIFCCAGAKIFEWIEEFDSEMFTEIKARVNEGRFIIVGGWYIQPDCNLPCGEGFARQGLYSQRYFKEKFGVTAKTGYNVDSFGHNLMIPQILKKQGMENYIFMRPKEHEKHLPYHIFRWRSPDGSEVIATRLARHYATHATRENIDSIETFTETLSVQEDLTRDSQCPEFFFYGVGNHGGGPTKKNIEMIAEMAKLHPESRFTYSNTNDFFSRVKNEMFNELPVFEDDLQHHASGCYSAVSKIKTAIRRAECEIIATEKFGMLANAAIGREYPSAEVFKLAWKNILFCHFHDCMGGCSIKPVYEDSEIMLGESRNIAAREQNNALQTLSYKIDTTADYGEPLVVFNPHDFAVSQVITVGQNTDHIFDVNGNELPSQIVHSPTALCKRDKGDTVFCAEVPAFGYTVYYKKRDDFNRPAEIRTTFKTKLYATQTSLENKYLRVEFSKESGYITSIFDKINSREVISKFGGVPVVIDESEHDTWSHDINCFDKEIGSFKMIESVLAESGAALVVIKTTYKYGNSLLTVKFSLCENSKMLRADCSVDWHEKQKMLKLRFDTEDTASDITYEIPFGVINRPQNGEEEPTQSWAAINGKNGGIALINNNKYSYSGKDGSLYLTAVRSPYYLDHGRGEPGDENFELTDQGESSFAFLIMPLYGTNNSEIIKVAKAFNTPATVIMESKHKGKLKPMLSALKKNAENIMISAFKRAEDGTGTVIRAYETDGKRTDFVLSGMALPVPLKAEFTPFSVDTYYLKDGANEWKKVLMTEFAE